MIALPLLQQLHELGVVLTPYPDGTLRYKAPKGTLTPALLDVMRQQKTELHTLVEAFEERATVAEYCGGLSREAAERLARDCLVQKNAKEHGSSALRLSKKDAARVPV
jgi:hypothetical protein